MALCGLWHGPDWNFVVWGLYHGAGLTVAALLQGRLMPNGTAAGTSLIAAPTVRQAGLAEVASGKLLPALVTVLTWAATMVFVGIGWLLFFYPVEKAATMALQLFVR